MSNDCLLLLCSITMYSTPYHAYTHVHRGGSQGVASPTRPRKVAIFRSRVLTAQTSSSDFAVLLVSPSSSSVPTSSTSRTHSSSPSSTFQPLHPAIQFVAAQTNLEVSLTSCMSDSTSIRSGEIALIRSGADWDLPVIRIEGEAYRFGNCFSSVSPSERWTAGSKRVSLAYFGLFPELRRPASC